MHCLRLTRAAEELQVNTVSVFAAGHTCMRCMLFLLPLVAAEHNLVMKAKAAGKDTFAASKMKDSKYVFRLNLQAFSPPCLHKHKWSKCDMRLLLLPLLLMTRLCCSSFFCYQLCTTTAISTPTTRTTTTTIAIATATTTTPTTILTPPTATTAPHITTPTTTTAVATTTTTTTTMMMS